VTDHGHVLGAMAGTEARLILAERHIENPVQVVFDTPMASYGLCEVCGRKRAGGDVGSSLGLEFCRRVRCGFRPWQRWRVAENAGHLDSCAQRRTSRRYGIPYACGVQLQGVQFWRETSQASSNWSVLGFIDRAGNDPRDVESGDNLDDQSAACRRCARRYSIISGECCRPDEVIE
jgi:hypothetical protein